AQAFSERIRKHKILVLLIRCQPGEVRLCASIDSGMRTAEIINLVRRHHHRLVCDRVSQYALCPLTDRRSGQGIREEEKICVAQLVQRTVNIGLPQSLKKINASAQPQ